MGFEEFNFIEKLFQLQELPKLYELYELYELHELYELPKLYELHELYKLMLTHIVCWKYKETTSPEQRLDHIAQLKNLPAEITVIESFDIGFDILRLERSFDLGLVAVFADREALDLYTVHPSHQAVAALGKQIAEKVISVDFLDS